MTDSLPQSGPVPRVSEAEKHAARLVVARHATSPTDEARLRRLLGI